MKKHYSGNEMPETPMHISGELSRRDFLKLAGMGAATSPWTDTALAGIFGESSDPKFHPTQLSRTHDLLSLPAWGPYSKKYFGISHIPYVRRGLSFDWSIFPLLTNGPVKLPSVTGESGVHPWEAAQDLEFYSLRFETIWKDRLYCDLSFSRLSSHSRLVKLELVNQTSSPQHVTLNCLAQLVFPPVKELTAEPIRLCTVELPQGAVWVHALDYVALQFAKPRPTDNLVTDGKWRAEERAHDCVGGSMVAQGFGKDPGDVVRYRVRLERPFSNAALIWRFQMSKGESGAFQMGGIGQHEIKFHGSGQFTTVTVPLGELKAGVCELRFSSAGGSAIALNGFAIAESEQAGQLRFVDAPWHSTPEINAVPAANGLILRYLDVPNFYGLSLGMPWAGHRELKWRELDAAFRNQSDPDTKERIFGDRRRGRAGDPDSLFVHVFSKPFMVAPNSKHRVYGIVCTGSGEQVRRCLAGFNPQSAANERVALDAQEKAFHLATTPAGESFRFSQQMMAAVTLTNLVYPLYTQRNYIRHYSPGRIWDCLYTWDSGFIGLGLLEINAWRVVDILNAYTTPPGAQSAFIHHGTPLPVQIYLYYELWNRTQSKELLEYFYPRVRQYHRFLAGRLGSSTTRRHRDHLICTWDYFYNTGGWDDYPPQKFVHQKKLTSTVTAVVNSAHTIRCAKLLSQAASALGYTEDLVEYDRDIAEQSASLQRYSWDAASGYFGYVVHNENGEPTGILRENGGANFNMGLDGVSPLVAGICSQEQEQQIIERLFSTKHLWTDVGITTVDRSAPYYSPNGYWNGSVWFAHQWFLWKTMLDLGRADLANRIAQTGLNIWKQVTDASYDCMEHFITYKPFGAGWHQFSSLSSPVLPWFASLYTPGRLTCGFEVWILECSFSQKNRQLRVKLKSTGKNAGRQFSVLACMNPDSHYRVRWNGNPAVFTTLHDGLLQIQLPQVSNPGELQISVV
jgi:hypothetical protein